MVSVRKRGNDDEEYSSKGEKLSAYQERMFGKKGSNPVADTRHAQSSRTNAWTNFVSDSVGRLGGGFGYLLGMPDLGERVAENFRAGAEVGTGQPVFRRPNSRTSSRPSSRRPSSAGGQRDLNNRRYMENNPVEEGVEEEASGKTLMDYIAEIESMMGGGPDFGALRDRLSSKTAESDARLEAMYRSLGQARDAAAPELTRTYDTAKSEIEKAAEQTAASISQGYQDAQSQRSEELAALGIQDAAARPEGERIAEDQGFARQIAAQGSQGSLNANAANKATSLAYNTDMRGVGDMQGVEARSTLQNRLQDQLAEIAFQESAQRAQSRQSAISQAMQMMQADQAAQGSGLTPYQQAQMEMQFAQFEADQQANGQRVSTEQQNFRARFWKDLLEQFGDTAQADQAYQDAIAKGLI